MPVTTNNFAKFRADVRAEMRRRVTRAAIEVSRHAKELISTAGPSHAPPGMPPHKQTGRLRSSVTYETVSDDTARAGTNVKYGRYQELGTGRMSARPWLVRAFQESGPVIVRYITAPWTWSG